MYATYGVESINTAAAKTAAYEGTAQGMVLLKNDGSLPVDMWSRKLTTLTVVGPHAVTQRELLGALRAISIIVWL